MVHGSKPQLMNHVVDAVVHLCERKGSTARDVLDYLRQTSKFKPRNLTMQVHRALKHAVNAGLLRHRSGRYKAIFTTNSVQNNERENENSDKKSVEETSKPDAQLSFERVNFNNKQNSGNREKERHTGKRKRDHSSQRRQERLHKSERRQNPLKHVRKIQKLKYKETDGKDRLTRYNSPDRRVKEDFGNTSRSSSIRKSSKARRRDRKNYSDPSDSSNCKDKKARGKKS
ncbi:uncharacterized protein LOC105663507 [Megachile rotundata]|uniref:uncharacterized protein LOC105663507 n=1 Tax=Megachile rotundata TaxID=143995 RepID=UPI003FD3A93D